mgnify:CR=1 FL=1
MIKDLEYLELVTIENNQFIFNEKDYLSFISKIPEDNPLAIISILGCYRSGKSFLLNIIAERLKDNNNISLPEIFPSKYSIEPVTNAILMQKDPIFININNKQIAVMLIDTPGLFDTKTNQDITNKLFGIVSLLSSNVIYNIEKRIQEDHLQNIGIFSEITKIAKNKNKIQHNLDILIRDYQNFDDITTNNVSTISNNYLKEMLEFRSNHEFDNTRNTIKSTFDNITCNLLPHPGFDILKKNAIITRCKLRDEFNLYLDNYLNNFIEHISIKKINDIFINKPLFKFLKIIRDA